MKVARYFLLVICFISCTPGIIRQEIPKKGYEEVWKKTKYIPKDNKKLLGKYYRKTGLTSSEMITLSPKDSVFIQISDGYLRPNKPVGFRGRFSFHNDTLLIKIDKLAFSDTVTLDNRKKETALFDSLNYISIYQKIYNRFNIRENNNQIYLIPDILKESFIEAIDYHENDEKYLEMYLRKIDNDH